MRIPLALATVTKINGSTPREIGAKMIVLTPTGRKNVLKLPSSFLNYKNSSIFLWYLATRNNAKHWSKNKLLKSYSKSLKKSYTHQLTLDGFSQMETITN